MSVMNRINKDNTIVSTKKNAKIGIIYCLNIFDLDKYGNFLLI